jgi:predicted DNA-binding protein
VLSDTCAKMSDMGSERITIRVSSTLGERLRQRSRIQGHTESELVREALETYLAPARGERAAYELAAEAGLIGVIPRGRRAAARDLSTHPRHMEGFGKAGSGRGMASEKI